VQNTATSVTVYLSFCLFVHSLISKSTCPTLRNSPNMLTVARARSFSDESAVGFADDVIFSLNGANGTESKMMLCLVEFPRVEASAVKFAVCCCLVNL